MNIFQIRELIEKKEICLYLETGITFTVNDDVFEPGLIRLHLPAPINASWLKEGQLVDSEPFFRMMSIEDYPQRSAYFNEILKENTSFTVKYAFNSVHRLTVPDTGLIDSTSQKTFRREDIEKYKDLSHCGCESYTGINPEKVLISDIFEEDGLPFKDKYLSFLRDNGIEPEQSGKLTGRTGSTARRIFDLVVGKYQKDGAESLNTVYVSMCRMCGIPARWQGGWACKDKITDCEPGELKGEGHDWCMLNLMPYGWILADCEFARLCEGELRDFFFGNIDPCMVPTASVPKANLYPAKDYARADEIYNYYGEAEIVPGKMTGEGHFPGRGLRNGEFSSQIYIKTLS